MHVEPMTGHKVRNDPRPSCPIRANPRPILSLCRCATATFILPAQEGTQTWCVSKRGLVDLEETRDKWNEFRSTTIFTFFRKVTRKRALPVFSCTHTTNWWFYV